MAHESPSRSVLQFDRDTLCREGQPDTLLRATNAKHDATFIFHDHIVWPTAYRNSSFSSSIVSAEILDFVEIEHLSRSRNRGDTQISDAKSIHRKRIRLAAIIKGPVAP